MSRTIPKKPPVHYCCPICLRDLKWDGKVYRCPRHESEVRKA